MNLLLLTGGKHPYEESTPVMTEFLQEAGHSLAVSESASELAGFVVQSADPQSDLGGSLARELVTILA